MDSSKNQFGYSILGESYDLPLQRTENQTKESILLNSTLLFAVKGYGSVSMRDIADSIGIKPASLYNHFASKEALWYEALDHAKQLYLLYFRHLDEALEKAGTFREVVAIMFHEPKRMVNVFGCYAFSMIRTEQFRDEAAAKVTNDIMIRYATDFTRRHFDLCVEKKMVAPFDTLTVASMIINCTLIAIDITLQRSLGRPVPYDVCESLTGLEQFVLRGTLGEEGAAAVGELESL